VLYSSEFELRCLERHTAIIDMLHKYHDCTTRVVNIYERMNDARAMLYNLFNCQCHDSIFNIQVPLLSRPTEIGYTGFHKRHIKDIFWARNRVPETL